jgi:hypothetical protein
MAVKTKIPPENSEWVNGVALCTRSRDLKIPFHFEICTSTVLI